MTGRLRFIAPGALRMMVRGSSMSDKQKACVGIGSVQRLGTEAAWLGQCALLVTGRTALRRAGTTDLLIQLLGEAGVEVAVFDEVPPEPDVGTVDRARERLRQAGSDLVVEAGGGSALDVGKAAAALAKVEAPTAEYHEGRDLPADGLPHIAVPTTAGSGAEATPNSVLIDAGRTLKKSIRGAGLLPDVCVVDAALTVSCPPALTAASGMDALSQAIESYLSVHASAASERMSLRAVALIVPNLPIAYARGNDLAAREGMCEGSYKAGVALAAARLGAVHGIAHPLGLFYELPHGVVCAALLPHVLRRNRDAVVEKYAHLSDAMGADPVEKVEELLSELSLPGMIGPYPDADQERAIMDYAIPTGSSRANPVPVNEDFVRGILRAVCKSL